jgi:GH35 family endo-1,4-beta-xylanase
VHNSGWVQAPGAEILSDPAQYPRMERYVKSVVGTFASDPRVLAWDLWNEPDNGNDSSYAAGDPRNKNQIVLELLPQVFAWARSVHPAQPLTSGLWHGDWMEFAGCDASRGPHPGRTIRHYQLSQLQLAGGF